MGQLLQGVGGLGVVFVNVRHLVVGLPVDDGVQQSDDHIAQDHTQGHQGHVGVRPLRVQGLGQQVKADNGRHNTGGKGQQQADRLAGILPKQAGEQSSQARTAHAGQGGDANNTSQIFHFRASIPYGVILE